MQHTPSDSSLPTHTSLATSADALEKQLARVLANAPPLVRLPKPGTRCPYTQLSRTALNELIAPTKRNGGKPPVEAIYQRAHRYAQRGTWLIPAENLFRYLLGLGTASVEEYKIASDLRLSDHGDEGSQKAAPVSRDTQKKGKQFPLSTRPAQPRTVEDQL